MTDAIDKELAAALGFNALEGLAQFCTGCPAEQYPEPEKLAALVNAVLEIQRSALPAALKVSWNDR